MKTAIQALSLCLLLCLISCQEDDVQANQSEVDRYIARLQSGDYNEIELPPLTAEAIPALLKYRNDTTRITSFPRNPLSSLYNPDCTLGMYVLWTIESIRLTYLQQENMMPGRFPSLNPMLARRGTDELEWLDRVTAQQMAASLYQIWWQHAQHMDLTVHMQIDPLAESDFYWH